MSGQWFPSPFLYRCPVKTTDSDTVETAGSAVKSCGPADTYGSGLQVVNDATNLAKKSAEELLRELYERKDLLTFGASRPHDVDAMVERTQGLARCEREILNRIARSTRVLAGIRQVLDNAT